MGININAIETLKIVREFLSDLKNKYDISIQDAFEDYIQTVFQKYLKTKTLLYRTEPKFFYSFYEPPFLKKGKYIISTNDVQSILDENNKIIISGTGGIGKSMLMQHFLLSSIINKLYIPILVPLRLLNDKSVKDISILDIIYSSIYECNFKLDVKYFDYVMQRGGFLVLLDGYDEVKEEIKGKVTEEVYSVCNKYSDNNYIVSSRYDDGLISLSNFVEFQIETLSKEQALSLVKKFEYDDYYKDKFYEELKNGLYEKYQSFASNSLLIS